MHASMSLLERSLLLCDNEYTGSRDLQTNYEVRLRSVASVAFANTCGHDFRVSHTCIAFQRP